MSKPDLLQLSTFAFLSALWAGAALAGNLVAAPAKFQVQTLELPVALQVGRAQFAWVGIIEWCFVVMIGIVLTLRFKFPPLLLAMPVAIFLIQQFWLQPLLQARSDLLVSGQEVASSHLHLGFAGLEVLKFLSLLLYSGTTIWALANLSKLAQDG